MMSNQTERAGEGTTNALESAASSYLRSARHQPVEWNEWSDAAFDRASQQDKPTLLDIGAVWCHWCHVMDRESYEDVATANLINQHFIAIKVDRDERPDVDARYQAAVSALSGQGGWPLTAFLTPDGKPYFGGTYFPPEDRHGRPSFQRVLLTMADAFRNRRTEVEQSALSVMSAIEHNESFSGRATNPGPELVRKIALSAMKSADLRNGGFGSQPKFPNCSAIDLLIDLVTRCDAQAATTVKLKEMESAPLAEAARHVVRLTLNKMARGGVCDQLAGGFHRYSVDDNWLVPHFEKMAYDNSELLGNYVHAYLTFGDEEFARVAREIIRWIDQCLSDRAQGGFYASQDADVTLDDDGDYFTWTLDEAAEALSEDELPLASYYYNIGEIGQMQHNVAKNVLHRKREIEAMAQRAGLSVVEVEARLDVVKEKLYAARLKRPTPYIDRTIYVAWNALCISAYIEAARALDLPDALAFALKSLDRVLATAWTVSAQTREGAQAEARRTLAHVVAYGEQAGTAPQLPGVLDDYILLGHAALDAWQATGEMRYYTAASELMDSALARFCDSDSEVGGFFDIESPTEGQRALGVMAARRKP